MGLFNPRSREEQAHYNYHENTRFREDLRDKKRNSEVRYEPPNWFDVTSSAKPIRIELASSYLIPITPTDFYIFFSPFCYAKTAFS